MVLVLGCSVPFGLRLNWSVLESLLLPPWTLGEFPLAGNGV
jgi:hypothetical protein